MEEIWRELLQCNFLLSFHYLSTVFLNKLMKKAKWREKAFDTQCRIKIFGLNSKPNVKYVLSRRRFPVNLLPLFPFLFLFLTVSEIQLPALGNGILFLGSASPISFSRFSPIKPKENLPLFVQLSSYTSLSNQEFPNLNEFPKDCGGI